MVVVRRRLVVFYAIHHAPSTVRSSLDSSAITFKQRALERARQVDGNWQLILEVRDGQAYVLDYEDDH